MTEIIWFFLGMTTMFVILLMLALVRKHSEKNSRFGTTDTSRIHETIIPVRRREKNVPH